MTGIIVVLPNKDNAVGIRNLLVRYGLTVTGVCTSGAQAVNLADALEEGIVICGYKLKDMMYTQLREYLPDSFGLLLVASKNKWDGSLPEGTVGLPMPIKAQDLMETLHMMLENMERRRKKRREEKKRRNPRQQKIIAEAKSLLMERNHMSEEEAHRYLQKNSMDSGRNMAETAEMILTYCGYCERSEQ
ncbi:MAG: ANTAR domain-containing protein [Lachnospiraceae bacterium]